MIKTINIIVAITGPPILYFDVATLKSVVNSQRLGKDPLRALWLDFHVITVFIFYKRESLA